MAPSQLHVTLDQLRLILDNLAFVDLVQLDLTNPSFSFLSEQSSHQLNLFPWVVPTVL